MSAPSRRTSGVLGTEALWLLQDATRGGLVRVRRETPVVRPAVHVPEYGWLIVRTPAQDRRPSVTCHVEKTKTAGGSGWTVTVTGSAEVISDPDEAVRHRRMLPGRVHGAHETLVRVRPHAVTGFRLAHTEAVR